MPDIDWDKLQDDHDRLTTHNDPRSPWYDGPDDDDVKPCRVCGQVKCVCYSIWEGEP